VEDTGSRRWTNQAQAYEQFFLDVGALIVDAPSDEIGAGLINQYLKVKKRSLL